MINLFYSLLLLANWGGATAAGGAAGLSQSNFIPVILVDSIHQATCADASDGAVFITVKQGEEPFTFEWSNGLTTQNLQDVQAGAYSCTVTDANGEQAFLTDVVVGAPPALIGNIDVLTPPDCLGNFGTVVASAQGGTPPYTFEWNNGDSGPVIEHLEEGTYTATITDGNGCSTTLSAEVYTDFPDALTNEGTLNCANPTIVLDGGESSTGDQISYLWTTTDGLILTNPDSIAIEVGSGGIYNLLVTNILNGCTAEAEAIVGVDSVPPFADAGDDFSLQCTNSTGVLNGDAPAGAQYAYHWSALAGGHLNGNPDGLSTTFDHTGTFVFSVFDSQNGCSSSDTVVVTGLFEPPSALAFGDTLTCLQDSAILTAQWDTVNTQFIWEGPNGFSSLLPSPQVGSPGGYVLTVTDTLSGCFSVVTADVLLDTIPPVIQFIFAENLNCANSSALIGVNVDTTIATGFYWTGPSGFESFEQSPMVEQPGLYIVQTTNLANGCTLNDTISVQGNFEPPVADAGPDRVMTCITTELILDGSGSTQGDSISYYWSTVDGIILGGDSSLTPTIMTAGTYALLVTNLNNGCTATDETVVTSETTEIIATATVFDTLSCVVSEVQVFGSTNPVDDVTYAWSGPDGFTSSDLNPVVSSFGTYTLTATYTPSGCTATASVYVATNAAVADAGPDNFLTCVVSSLTLDGSGSSSGNALTYLWTTADGHIVSGETSLTPVVDAVGTYVLTVADTVNICSSTAETIVAYDTLPPLANAGADQTLTCSSLTAILDGSASSGNGTLQFAWDTNDGNFVGGADTATPEADAAGEYHLVLTDLSNGCSAADTVLVDVDQNFPVAGATVVGTLSCVTHIAQLFGTSSTPGSSFHWTGPNGFVSDEQNTIVTNPGEYTLTVKNSSNGCSATVTATVSQNIMPPTLTSSGGVITCAHPEVTMMTTAQPANATFTWIGPGGFTSSVQNPTVTLAGMYTVTATNPMNGCTNSVSVIVSQNIAPPTVNAGSSGALTCLQPTVVLNATATPAGAAFNWEGPNGFSSNVANPTVAAAGLYTVTATSAVNGCTASTVAFVDDNTQPPTAYAGLDLPLSCFNGLLTLNGIGSSSGSQYTYNWTTADGHIIVGEHTLMPRVDEPGTYILVVTNTANGCTATDEAIITLPTDVTAVISATQPVGCNGGSDGSATVTASGGTLVYTYVWSNGASTATASNLSAGIYAVTVYDQAACTAIVSATITEPAVLVANVSVTNETLPGANNGTASATMQGGTGPYTYLWSNGATTANISNLAPGVYTLTATDSHGCTATGIATVNASTCALAATATATPVKCFGENNGSATANVTGAVGPPAFLWSNGATTATVQNLAPGNYSFTVTDLAGCQVSVPVQITTPQALSLVLIAQQNILCINDLTGSLSVASSGGTGPYSYSWSNGGSTPVQTGLGAGPYSLTATDSKGCTKTFSVTISTTDENPPLVITKDATVALGANGTASITTALIDNGSADGECGISSLVVSPTAFGCADLGTHIVVLTATDVNGNSASATATVTVTDNIAPTLACPANIVVGACQSTVQFAVPQPLDNCPIDPAQLTQTSGLPSGSVFPEGATSQTFQYTDPAGNAVSCTFTVSVSPALSVAVETVPTSCGQTCDGSASLDIDGGALPYAILWSNGSTAPTLSNLCYDGYTATVTDAQGCSQVLIADVQSGDQEAPVLLLQNATVALNSFGTISITPGNFNIGSSDNCSDIYWQISPSEFDCTQIGDHVITLKATDGSGNSAQQTVIATIVDNIDPTLLCPDDVVVGLCDATVEFLQPIVMDNCDTGLPELTEGLASGSQFPLGTTLQVFTAVDPSGNVGTCSFSIVVQEAFTVASNVTQVSCAGLCNGSISLSVTGGGAPFSILWNNGATGASLQNLCPGNYSATVTDNAGCSQEQSFSITEPAAMNIMVDGVQQDVNDLGVGGIQVTVSGGNAPYVFAWLRDGQPFASTEDLTGLHSGTYQLILTDANGCSTSGPTLVITSNVSAATEPTTALNVVLAPNPAQDWVTLRFSDPITQTLSLYLFDATGRVVRTEQIASGTQQYSLDIQALPAGLWQVHLLDAQGRRTTKQLVTLR